MALHCGAFQTSSKAPHKLLGIALPLSLARLAPSLSVSPG